VSVWGSVFKGENMRFMISITLFVIALLSACGENLEDPDPPARPEWVVKSLPEDTTETGIDADPNGDVINLEWLTGSEDDISNYRLYRAIDNDEDGFDLLTEIIPNLTAGTVNSYIDEDVSIDRDYFYFLRAIDQAGNLSTRSDTIRYKLVTKVNLLEPSGTISSVSPTFKWNDPSNSVSEYIIRVEQFNPHRVVWIASLIRSGYTDDEQSRSYGSTGSVFQNELSRDVIYRWRIDGVGNFDRENEISGSESNWSYFIVQ